MHLKGSPDVKYAVKIYIKNSNEDAQIRHFRQEGVLKKMLHPNIIKLHDMSETGKLSSIENDTSDVRYAVLELASNGNFLDYIANNAMDQQIARYYFKQLWEAVAYMHSENVCHRDLKLENLLLDSNFNLKVSDFGFWTNIFEKYYDGLLGDWKGTPG